MKFTEECVMCTEKHVLVTKRCSLLEQRFVIKSLVAEKHKPCEIYRRICDVHGTGYFNFFLSLQIDKA